MQSIPLEKHENQASMSKIIHLINVSKKHTGSKVVPRRKQGPHDFLELPLFSDIETNASVNLKKMSLLFK